MRIDHSVGDELRLLQRPGVRAACSSVIAAHLIATGSAPHWWLLFLQLGAVITLVWSSLVLGAADPLGRDRQLPSRGVLVRVGGLMFAGLGLAALAGGASFRVAAALGLAILAYHWLMKDSLLGPALVGAWGYMHWMLGLAAGVRPEGAALLAVPVFLYALAVAVLARVETGEAETREAAAGVIRFAAVLFGASVLMVAALVIAGILAEPLVLIALVVPVLPLVYGLLGLWKDPSQAAVSNRMDWLELGLIPLNALLLLGSGHWLAGPALLLLVLPGLWFAQRLGLPGDRRCLRAISGPRSQGQLAAPQHPGG